MSKKRYELLQDDEVIQEGDQWLDGRVWRITTCEGSSVPTWEVDLYRRLTFPVPIYDCEVTISISKVLPSDVAGLKPSPDDQEFFDDSTACAFKNGRLVLVAFKPGLLSHDTIAHELFHVTHYILSRANVRLTKRSDEAHAYLAGFLAGETYKSLKKITKERIK